MCDELKEAIESYLQNAVGTGWVKSRDLCDQFDISDRQLRQAGCRAGLCSEFAISGDKGFKHVTNATKAEYRRFKHRLRRHAISELVRTRNLDRRRNRVVKTVRRPAFAFQKDNGQGVLL